MEPYLSPNEREGSLGEVSLATVLETCRKHRFTGKIVIRAGSENGELELNAGVVDAAQFGDTLGQRAIADMCKLRQGGYVLSQRLPALDGSLGDAAAFESRTRDLPLVAIMRHCEENAVTCVVEVTCGDDRGEIHYRLGEITKITLNGERDDDAIVTLVNWKKARFCVMAQPLDPSVQGWPAVRTQPTDPFQVIVRRKSRIGWATAIGLAAGALEVATLGLLTVKAPEIIESMGRFLEFAFGH